MIGSLHREGQHIYASDPVIAFAPLSINADVFPFLIPIKKDENIPVL
jgi:hypothetical protein